MYFVYLGMGWTGAKVSVDGDMKTPEVGIFWASFVVGEKICDDIRVIV